jgi:hypothetical protein
LNWKASTLAKLKACGWNQTHAAAELGMSRSGLKDRVARLRKAGEAIPAFSGIKTGSEDGSDLSSELKSERDKNTKLEVALAKARSTAPVKPVSPVKRKREREDRVIVVFPDVHGAHLDRYAVGAFLGDLSLIDPDMVVGLGDLVDCGGFLAQHHVWGFVADASYSYEDDLKQAGAFLDDVQNAAPSAEVHALEGNHDLRPEKWAVTQSLRQRGDAEFLRRLVAPQEILGFAKRGIRYYRRSETYGDCTVQGAFKIGHLTFMHGLLNGGNQPSRVLDRFGTSVCYGHTHQIASHIKRGPNGPIGAYNIGTLARLQPLYAHGSPTLWAHGYGVVVMARSGRFQFIQVNIVNGESLLPEMKLK